MNFFPKENIKTSNVTKNDGSHKTNFNNIFKTKKKANGKKEKMLASKKAKHKWRRDDVVVLLSIDVVCVPFITQPCFDEPFAVGAHARS